jgi:hypothetical protein
MASGSRGRRTFRIALTLAALHGLWFSGVLAQRRSLAPGDGTAELMPSYLSAFTLWTPDIASGYPVAASPDALSWYAVAALGRRASLPFELFVISAYFLASLNGALFVRALTGSVAGGLAGGICLGLGGFFAAHVGHANMLHSAAWIPLVLWSLERLRTRVSAGTVAVAGGSLALSAVSGYPQFLLKALVLSGLWIVLRSADAPVGRRRFITGSAAAVSSGLLLAAPLLLPMAQLSTFTARQRISFEFFSQGSFPAWQLPSLLFPQVVGGWRTLANRVPYFGDWYVSDVTAYSGSVFSLLAALGLGGRPRRVALFFGGVTGAALLLAVGDATPLARVLYHVPVFSLFRSPSRYLFEATLGVSVLAGLGVARLETLAPGDRLRAAGRAAAGVAALFGAALAALRLLGPTFAEAARRKVPVETLSLAPWRNPVVAEPIGFLVAGAALLFFAARSPRRWPIAAVVCLGTAELATYGLTLFPSNFPELSRVTAEPAAARFLAGPLAASAQRYAPLLGARMDLEAGTPNHSRIWALPNATGFGPLPLLRYCRLLGMERWGELSRDVLWPSHRGLDVLAVRYVLLPSDRSDRWIRDAGAETRFRKTTSLRETEVLENLTARPRAWLAAEVVRLSPDEVLGALRSSRLPDGRAFEPERQALVEAGPSWSSSVAAGPSHVRISGLRPDSVAIETGTPGTSFLVLSDIFYPGWRATVDGRPADVVRTDYVLRGLWLTPGAHSIRLEFRPPAVGAGLALSALAVLSLAVWGALGRGRQGAGVA